MGTKKKMIATATAAVLLSGMGYVPAAMAEDATVQQDSAQQSEQTDAKTQGQADDAAASWMVNGIALALDSQTGAYGATMGATLDQQPPATLSASSTDGTVTLSLQPDGNEQMTDTALGRITVSGTANWQGTTPDGHMLHFAQPYSYDLGASASVTVDGHALQSTLQDGVFQAAGTVDLNADNTPSASTVEVLSLIHI